jgi:serine protease inhibitor
MENNKTINEPVEEKKNSKWKSLVKKFGIGGIIFFTVKGIITSTLIYFLGKNFWTVITNYFATIFD